MKNKIVLTTAAIILYCFCVLLSSCDVTIYPKSGVGMEKGRKPDLSVTDYAGIEVEVLSLIVEVELKDNADNKTICADVKNYNSADLSYSWFVGGDFQKGRSGREFEFKPLHSNTYQVDCCVFGEIDGRKVFGFGHLVVER